MKLHTILITTMLAACTGGEGKPETNREIADRLAESACAHGVDCGDPERADCAQTTADWICTQIDCEGSTPEYASYADECVEWLDAPGCNNNRQPQGCQVPGWEIRREREREGGGL